MTLLSKHRTGKGICGERDFGMKGDTMLRDVTEL